MSLQVALARSALTPPRQPPAAGCVGCTAGAGGMAGGGGGGGMVWCVRWLYCILWYDMVCMVWYVWYGTVRVCGATHIRIYHIHWLMTLQQEWYT